MRRVFTSRRRGAAVPAAIVWMLLGGALLGAGVLVAPRIIEATASHDSTSIRAREPEHQAVIDQLASLLRRSHRVLGIHPPGDTPVLDIALWIDDHENPGVMDLEEFGVISWSPTLQAVTFHSIESVDALDDDDAIRDIRSLTAGDRSACRRMRQHPDASRRVLAGGLSDVSFEIVEMSSSDHGNASHVSITLTWHSHSADDFDEASTTVVVSR